MADATWLVARREIREAVRSSSYKVTLALSAVVLAVIIVIANVGTTGATPTPTWRSRPTLGPW